MKIETYKKIILDFDGVVCDSNILKEKAITEAIQFLPNSHLKKEFLNFFKKNTGLTREHKTDMFFEEETKIKILSNYSSILERDYYSCSLIRGVEELINHSHSKNIDLIVVSGGAQEEVEKYLKIHNLSKYFLHILGGPVSKEEHFGSLEIKDKTLFFGDSKLDFEMAIKFKIDFVFVHGATSLKNWQSKLNFPPHFSNIKDFGDITYA